MWVRSLALAVCAALTLAGCAGGLSGRNATDEEVAAAAYKHNGPSSLTLYTMINNRTGSGAHTSLMINASQRVVFDPAGSVRLKAVPEVNDVLYGITPEIRQFYESAHARETYHVKAQTVIVPAEVAERALRLAVSNGAVSPSMCTNSTSQILSKLPGFESVSSTWFPNNLSAQFGKLPGVTTRVLRENDDDDKDIAIAQFQRKKDGE